MMNSSTLVRKLYKLADLLEIRETNTNKADAIRDAAMVVEGMKYNDSAQLDIDALDVDGWVKELVHKWIRTDEATELIHLQSEVPLEVQQMLRFPRLSPKQIGYLYRTLGIDSFAKLEAAAKKQRLRKLPGFGAKVELHITKSIKQMKTTPENLPIAFAYPIAYQLLKRIRRYPEISRAEIAGGLRRFQEIVEKIDIIVATEQIEVITERIINLPNLTQVVSKSERKITVVLQYLWEVYVDIHITTEVNFGMTWLQATGSESHIEVMQQLIEARDLPIDRLSLSRCTEQEIYQAVSLPYMPPEIREGRDIIQRISSLRAPLRFIEVNDLQGDLHMHTNWSDGGNSIEEMARAARDRGYRYIAITDHSRSLKIAGGLSIERLLKQKEEIKKIERKLQQEQGLSQVQGDFTILCGIEMDILADGTPDYPDELLQEMDVVIASIHTNFKQDEYTMTKRIIQAVLNRHVDFIAHPTGRMIAKREAYPVNMEILFKATKETGTALELNSNPERLDLKAEYIYEAIYTHNIPITINTDAHAIEELNNIDYGIGTARRGWVKPEHVINTWPLDQLMDYLRRND